MEVTDDYYNQYVNDIWDGYIVYGDARGGNSNILLYDLVEGREALKLRGPGLETLAHRFTTSRRPGYGMSASLACDWRHPVFLDRRGTRVPHPCLECRTRSRHPPRPELIGYGMPYAANTISPPTMVMSTSVSRMALVGIRVMS